MTMLTTTVSSVVVSPCAIRDSKSLSSRFHLVAGIFNRVQDQRLDTIRIRARSKFVYIVGRKNLRQRFRFHDDGPSGGDGVDALGDIFPFVEYSMTSIQHIHCLYRTSNEVENTFNNVDVPALGNVHDDCALPGNISSFVPFRLTLPHAGPGKITLADTNIASTE